MGEMTKHQHPKNVVRFYPPFLYFKTQQQQKLSDEG